MVGSESGQKKRVKFLQNMGYSTIHPPPPRLVWERGGGGQREDRGATVHKYSFFVHGGNSSQAGSKIATNE